MNHRGLRSLKLGMDSILCSYFLTGSTGLIGSYIPYFRNFFRKLMKTNKFPVNPVNPV